MNSSTLAWAAALLAGAAWGCGGDAGASSGGGGAPAGGQGGSGGAATGGAPATGGGLGTGGSVPFTGETQVDGAGDAVQGSASLAIAPDGTIYVSWVRNSGQGPDVVVARSTDGGETFGPPASIDGPAVQPIVTMARFPRLAAADARVAVAFNEQNGTVHLALSAATPLSFSLTPIGTDVATPFRDFPKPVFLADGSVAVAWHGYPATGARIFFSRENGGFASEDASGGAPGVPCECCPIDVRKTGSGALLLAFRNNDDNVRNMWLAQAPTSGVFSDWVEVSPSEGTVAQCPMEGPRVAQTSAGHAMVWSTRGNNDKGSVLFATSSNGGASWSQAGAITGLVGDQPTVAAGESGTLYVAAETGNGASSLATSSDGGASWTPPAAVVAPDGNLTTPQAESAAGIAAIAGVSSASTVWFLRME
jgi:hypothetical protein